MTNEEEYPEGWTVIEKEINDDSEFFTEEELQRLEDIVRFQDSMSIDDFIFELNQLSGVQAKRLRWYEVLYERIRLWFHKE